MAQTSVASGTTSVLLLAANPNRKGFVIENSDANRCHILMDSAAATTSTAYSYSLAQNENSGIVSNYTGEVNAIWAADGTGVALVTEW